MNVLIVVTHLLGSGHLSRALTLGRAFAQDGHNVRVISGGMPVPHLDKTGVRLVQLPPLRSDGVNFARLLGEDGSVADDSYHANRQAVLIRETMSEPADVVITELFPFGRRTLKTEFEALLGMLQTLTPKPLVLSSVRDILAPPSKPSKAEYAEAQIDGFYDGVLVHSDPALTPLDVSWPVSTQLAPKLTYTGFVAPPFPAFDPNADGTSEVIVSAGGGNVGAALFHAALEAAVLRPDWQWRILVGGANADTQIAGLRAKAPHNVHIENARPDFRQMLAKAKASVSMCGYNTALDILQSGVRAVFVPFDAGGEVEQSLRAKALAGQNGITVVTSAEQDAQTLVAALDDTLRADPRPMSQHGFDGASRTVSLVSQMVAQR